MSLLTSAATRGGRRAGGARVVSTRSAWPGLKLLEFSCASHCLRAVDWDHPRSDGTLTALEPTPTGSESIPTVLATTPTALELMSTGLASAQTVSEVRSTVLATAPTASESRSTAFE